jgi:hypothetical protein
MWISFILSTQIYSILNSKLSSYVNFYFSNMFKADYKSPGKNVATVLEKNMFLLSSWFSKSLHF